MAGPRAVGAMLAELERARAQSAYRAGLWLTAIGLLSAGAATFLLFVNRTAAASAAMVGASVFFAVWRRHLASVQAEFKALLMPRIMAQVHPGLDAYDPDGLPQEQFDAPELFEKPDEHRYKSKDLMAGRIGDTAMAFAMIDASKVDDSSRTRRPDTIFRGLIFIADFHKNFHGRTVVGSAGVRSVGSHLLERVEIEDPRFDRAFTVMSTDQVEARYLLTPGFCERLLALGKHFDSLDAVFHDSCIVLALGADYDFLEPDVKNPIGEAQFNEMVRELEEIVAFVEHLKLNTRIWSKKPEARTA